MRLALLLLSASLLAHTTLVAASAGPPPRGPATTGRSGKVVIDTGHDLEALIEQASAAVQQWLRLKVKDGALLSQRQVEQLILGHNAQCNGLVCECEILRTPNMHLIMDRLDAIQVSHALNLYTMPRQPHMIDRVNMAIGRPVNLLNDRFQTSVTIEHDFYVITVRAEDRRDPATGQVMTLRLKFRRDPAEMQSAQ